MKASWLIKYPTPAFVAQADLPSIVPIIGGSRFGVRETQAQVSVEFVGDGAISASLQAKTGFDAAGQGIGGSVSGEGSGRVGPGTGLKLSRASFGLWINGIISVLEAVLDIVCKAVTGGACPLKEAEDWPLIGWLVKQFNKAAEIGVQLEPDVDAKFNFRGDTSGMTWESGTARSCIETTLSLIFDVLGLTAELYGTADPCFTLQVPKNPSYLKQVVLELCGGIVFRALGLEKKVKWCKDWIHTPSSLLASDTDEPSVQIWQTDWQPIARDYADEPSRYAVFHGSSRKQALGETARPGADHLAAAVQEQLIVSNVFPESRPALASSSAALLVWVHDDISKPELQGTELYYSSYNGSTWTMPAAVTEDHLLDLNPVLATDRNGHVIAVWERNRDVQVEPMGLEPRYVKGFEIAYAEWDGSQWTPPAYLTDNEAFDHAPVLVRGNDGSLLLVWRQNPAGEFVGSAVSPDAWYYAIWNGTAWGAPTLLLGNVQNAVWLAAARHDADTMAIVYSQDLDGDVSTSDEELYLVTWDGSWGSPQRLTDDAQPDTSPALFYDSIGSPRLLWLKGQALYALLGNLTSEPRQILGGDVAVADFAAAQDEEGNLFCVWQGLSAEGLDAWYIAYDEASDSFSLAQQLTRDAAMEKFMAPVFTSSGALLMAYAKTRLERVLHAFPSGVVREVLASTETDLYVLRNEFGSDLALRSDEMWSEPLNPQPGGLAHISVVLHNVGEKVVNDPYVDFYLGDPQGGGRLAGRLHPDLTLVGGMSTTLSLELYLPSSDEAVAVYAVADPHNGVVEKDESNNTAHCLVAMPNLVAHSLTTTYGETQAVTLTAQVANEGVTTASSTEMAFRLSDPITGTSFATVTVPMLVAGEETEVSIVWDVSGLPTGRYRAYGVLDSEGTIPEANETDNACWTTVAVLPDLVLNANQVSLLTWPDGTTEAEITITNKGLRDAVKVDIAVYASNPGLGATPLEGTYAVIPVGGSEQVYLNLGVYDRSGFWVTAGFDASFDDRFVGDNVVLVGEYPLYQVSVPLVARQ